MSMNIRQILSYQERVDHWHNYSRNWWNATLLSTKFKLGNDYYTFYHFRHYVLLYFAGLEVRYSKKGQI